MVKAEVMPGDCNQIRAGDSNRTESNDLCLNRLNPPLVERFTKIAMTGTAVQNINRKSAHSWEHILKHHRQKVTGIDVLIAPHHGRDSNRNYDFLKTLTPTVTLFGNASSRHLAYDCYPETRITNNQAGYVVINITEDKMTFYVKNYDFARDFTNRRKWEQPSLNKQFNSYPLFALNAK